MLTFTNTTRIPPLPFRDYLNLPYYSHSFLKYNVNGVSTYIEPTDAMILGSMVDAILCKTPHDYFANPQYKYAKVIASTILRLYPSLANMGAQVPFTGIAHVGDLQLPMKVLPDFELPNWGTIDLKVTDTHPNQFEDLIAFMGYDNQVFIQKSLSGNPKAYLLIYSTKTDTMRLIERTDFSLAETWLIGCVCEFGGVGKVSK